MIHPPFFFFLLVEVSDWFPGQLWAKRWASVGQLRSLFVLHRDLALPLFSFCIWIHSPRISGTWRFNISFKETSLNSCRVFPPGSPENKKIFLLRHHQCMADVHNSTKRCHYSHKSTWSITLFIPEETSEDVFRSVCIYGRLCLVMCKRKSHRPHYLSEQVHLWCCSLNVKTELRYLGYKISSSFFVWLQSTQSCSSCQYVIWQPQSDFTMHRPVLLN